MIRHGACLIKSFSFAAVVLALIIVAASCFLSGFGFGFLYGERGIGGDTQLDDSALNLAGHVAMIFSVAFCLGAGALITRLTRPLLPKVQRFIRFLICSIFVVLCVWALSMLSLRGYGPDGLIVLRRAISKWILALVE